MATVKDVARIAQVSAAAVSRVLNRDDNISVTSEVRMRIIKAAHDLGYIPPKQRKAMKTSKKLTIGVADWQIIRQTHANMRLSSLDCLVQMMTSEYDITFKRLLFGHIENVDGVIAFGVFTEEEKAFLRSVSYHIVFINSDQHNYEYDQVQVDFDRGLRQITEYLLDSKRYKGVGYIGGLYESGNIRIGYHRLDGLKSILKERDCYEPDFFHVGEISRESGYELAKKAALSGSLAEAMLLGSDEVAEGALEAFRELGLRVPKDVAVVIYQDIETLHTKWPTGTCVEMFPDYVWQNAIELLLDRIGGKRMQAVTVTVPTHIKIGDTA
ncbi:LacI family DNA-binding transcriptional regulator [Kineothrix sedimenti]|uniref:LacI family DNA-binding transcriptional regulator n=1 Tax=Kineothrix sedimenti TaxID=3123317 RepID=A0ABZ3EVB6_9FIRM